MGHIGVLEKEEPENNYHLKKDIRAIDSGEGCNKFEEQKQQLVASLSFEPEFKEYVQTLEAEMQSDISMAERGQGQLTESERMALNKRMKRHQ